MRRQVLKEMLRFAIVGVRWIRLFQRVKTNDMLAQLTGIPKVSAAATIYWHSLPVFRRYRQQQQANSATRTTTEAAAASTDSANNNKTKTARPETRRPPPPKPYGVVYMIGGHAPEKPPHRGHGRSQSIQHSRGRRRFDIHAAVACQHRGRGSASVSASAGGSGRRHKRRSGWRRRR